MPLHGYTTDRRPPTVLDHLLAHPFQFGFAGWGVLGGLGSILAACSSTTVSPSVDALPVWLGALIGAFLVVGGVSQIRGLLDDSDDITRGWSTERQGLVLSAVAWAGYGISIIDSMPRAVLSWTLAVCMVLMLLLRFAATVIEERRLRRRKATQEAS